MRQSGTQYLTSHLELVKKLIDSFYVDDIATGASTEEEAFQLYIDLKILKDGAFNFNQFSITVNGNECCRRTHKTPAVLEETYANAMLGKPHSSEAPTVKVLGVTWNPQDFLHFGVSDIAEAAATKNIISIIGKFYDPLGFLAPVTIRFKKLFQKLCETSFSGMNPYLMRFRKSGELW